MSNYILGHGPNMMKRFKDRSLEDGVSFIEPLLPDSGIVVDLGCGSAVLASWISENRKKTKVIAIDRELSLIPKDYLERRDNLLLVQGDAYNIPLYNESVDLIYMQALCMYLESTESVLAEAYRILKPKGKIALRNSVSVINNMGQFVNDDIFEKVLQYTLKKNNDNPRVAFNISSLLDCTGYSNIQMKTSIESSKDTDDIQDVARSTIELFKSNIGDAAVQDHILSETDRRDIITNLETWSNYPKAYNRAIWLEHTAEKA